MAKRIRLGLIFSYDDRWIGGTYYFLSLIKALDCLEDEDKPHIVAFLHKPGDLKIIKELNYPYLSAHLLEPGSRRIKRWERRIQKLSLGFIKPFEIWRDRKVDMVYLYRHDTPYFSNVKRKIFWVADFQEFVLREYFTDEEFEYRSSVARYAAETGYPLVLSSEDARRDFEKFFPNHKCEVHVVRFASLHPDFNHLDINELKEKYNITRPYFICANQFWQHKNHMTILKSLLELSEEERNQLQVIFTGKNFDYRSKNYFESLDVFIRNNNLTDIVKYIGFIPREDQLCLMKNALSIIQPSLFEGWSTTVEDAKQLNCPIILSDISVHKEQDPQNAYFFKARDPKDLGERIREVYNNPPSTVYHDYNQNVKYFGETFLQVIQNQ